MPEEWAESMAVQIARIDGKLDLIVERTASLSSRMGAVEHRTSLLESTTQRLDLERDALTKAKAATWLPVAQAITALAAFAGFVSFILTRMG